MNIKDDRLIDNLLLGKNKKKEPKDLEKSLMGKMLNRKNINTKVKHKLRFTFFSKRFSQKT